MNKFEAALQQLNEAVDNFEEILSRREMPGSLDYEILRDAAIKRFELVYDASWKAIKAWLEEKGAACASPLDCFREAYRQGAVGYQDVWLGLVKIRNRAPHTHNEKLAEKVHQELPDFLSAFRELTKYLNEHKP